jgi:hypothetical protein
LRDAIFSSVNDRPLAVEEHDGWADFFGPRLVVFGDRIKLLSLTRANQNRIAIASSARLFY